MRLLMRANQSPQQLPELFRRPGGKVDQNIIHGSDSPAAAKEKSAFLLS